MKISFVMGFFLPVPPLAGGAVEKSADILALEFANAGHQVTIFSRRWPGLQDDTNAAGVRHIRIAGANHSSSLALNLLHDAAWSWRIATALKNEDVVISSSVLFPIIQPLRSRERINLFAWIGRMPKGQTRLYGNVKNLIATSAAVATKIRTENPLVAEKISVLPYPIDCQLLQQTRLLRQPMGKITLGYAGRIHPEKGIDLLLDAAEELHSTEGLPEWRLLILGPSEIGQGGGGRPYLDLLQRRSRERMPGRVEFREPAFDSRELASAYAEMDIFCYPSLAESGETFGVAVAEAMASGAVPVVSSLDCFKDLVEDGQNGLVFNHRSASAPHELAQTLAGLLRTPGSRDILAKKAASDASQFDITVISRKWLDLLQKTLPL